VSFSTNQVKIANIYPGPLARRGTCPKERENRKQKSGFAAENEKILQIDNETRQSQIATAQSGICSALSLDEFGKVQA
jgi:hypothetical protein